MRARGQLIPAVGDGNFSVRGFDLSNGGERVRGYRAWRARIEGISPSRYCGNERGFESLLPRTYWSGE